MEDKKQRIIVPKSFVEWVDKISEQVSKTTGYYKNRVMTLQMIAKKIKYKIIMRWLFK